MKIMGTPEPRSGATPMREKLFHLTKISFSSFWPLAYFTSIMRVA